MRHPREAGNTLLKVMVQRGTDAKRLLVLLFALGASAFLAEGLVRLRQYFKYGSGTISLYRTAFDEASGLTIPGPGQVTASLRIDSRGFRSPELLVPKPPRTIRVAFLGASTTFCAEASRNEATWPHLVWQGLQETWPEVRFDYLNAAVPGYTVASTRRNLKYRVRDLQPDIIMIYEAVNDLSLDSRALAKEQGIVRLNPNPPGRMEGWSLAWHLVAKNVELMSRQSQPSLREERLVFDPEVLSGGFQNRLRTLVEESRQIAPVVVLATFSQRVRRDQSPPEQIRACNTHFYYMPYMTVEGLLKGFEEYNRVIREVAREASAVLVERENDIPGDDRYFHDSVHFTDRGCEWMAGRVRRALADSGAVGNLVQTRRLEAGHRSVPHARP